MNQLIRHITFNEEAHSYIDEFNSKYTSVTQQIEEYKEPFDKDYWSKKKAQELGVTQKDILDSWNGITKIACDKGNVIHKRLETSINDASFIKVPNATYKHRDNPAELVGYEISLVELRQTPLALHYQKILKLVEFYVEQGWKIYTEKRFYLVEYLIAGTIDLILFKDDKFIIVDWKTNKDDLHFVSGYYKKVNGIKTAQWVNKKSYFKFPLHKVEECKGNSYTLQLSSYAWMVEQWGFKCVGLILCHIRETVEEVNIVKEKKVDIMKIQYLKTEIGVMFNHRKMNRGKDNNKPMKFSGKYSWEVVLKKILFNSKEVQILIII